MKKTILITSLCLALFILCNCNKQPQGFTITGNVTGFKDSTMILLKNLDTQQSLDTTYIVNNNFVFKGKVDHPQRLFMMTKSAHRDSAKYTSLWVENSNIKLTGSFDTFQSSNIEGSKSQDTEKILKEWTQKLDQERQQIVNAYFTPKEPLSDSVKATMRKRMHEIDKTRGKYYRKFIDEQLNSYPALEMLSMMKNDISKDSVKMFFNRIDPQFNTTKFYQVLKIFVETKIITEGDQFAEIEAKTIDNKPFKLSSIKGKYILLDFWSAGCGPCRRMNKDLATKYNQLKDKVELVSFSIDNNPRYWEMATKQDNIQWTNISDLKGRNSLAYIQYGITGVPCSFLIDPQGKIVEKTLGYSPEHLEQIIKKIAEASSTKGE